MRYALLLCLLLCGCATPDSEKLANSARSDLTTVEGILSDLDKNIPQECQNILKSDLMIVSDKIKVIDEKIESSVNACRLEKDILKSGITKRNWIIGVLVLVLAIGCLLKIKKYI